MIIKLSIKLIQKQLTDQQSKEKYLDILNVRIEDNRKSIGKIFIILILTTLSFPLLIDTKIVEISLGPFKIIDSNIVLSLLPLIFNYSYYKYLMIWYDLAEQKITYKLLTSIVFNIGQKSFLNERLKPFSITDSISKHHNQEKNDKVGYLAALLLIPSGLILILFPFIFEIYLLIKVFEVLRPKYFFEWLIFITSILTVLFTILMLIQVIKNDLNDEKHSNHDT